MDIEYFSKHDSINFYFSEKESPQSTIAEFFRRNIKPDLEEFLLPDHTPPFCCLLSNIGPLGYGGMGEW